MTNSSACLFLKGHSYLARIALNNSPSVTLSNQLTPLARACVRAVMYFDMFKYPLNAGEVWKSLTLKAEQQDVLATLQGLTPMGMLAEKEGFYALPSTIQYLDQRKAGNELAALRMKDAERSARIIAGFPFVQAVMISGSLSKNYMDPGSDVDFFIVTTPGRLWVARTMLILYKKVFLLNSHSDFCVNYFVDTDHLEIEDKNIFTATETVFLFPMVNAAGYSQFRDANPWADTLFPNFGRLDTKASLHNRLTFVRRMGEGLFKGNFGNMVDAWCMRQTINRWKSKFKDLDPGHFDVAMRSRKYVSKHHPGNYQAVVTSRVNQRIQEFESLHGVSLCDDSAVTA